MIETIHGGFRVRYLRPNEFSAGEERGEIPAVCTASDLQRILQIGRAAAYDLLRQHGTRIGRRVRISRVAVERLVTERRTE